MPLGGCLLSHKAMTKGEASELVSSCGPRQRGVKDEVECGEVGALRAPGVLLQGGLGALQGSRLSYATWLLQNKNCV